MMTTENFSTLIHELRKLDGQSWRDDLSKPASAILSAFIRNTPYDSGAVYLLSTKDSQLRLAAMEGELLELPEHLEGLCDEWVREENNETTRIDERLRRKVLLSSGSQPLGFVALGNNDRTDAAPDQRLLAAAANFLSAILETQRMAGEVRDGEFRLRSRVLELEALYDIGLSIASTLDLEELSEEILIRTLSLLDAGRAALYLRDGEGFKLYRAFGEVRSLVFGDEIDEGIASKLLKEMQPVNFAEGADCIFPGCASLMAVPIHNGSEVIGILATADRERRDGGIDAFSDNDLRLLSLFANQAAIALENARLHRAALEKQAMEQELKIAATIQQEILPSGVPQFAGAGIAAVSRPARQLGGDYHAFFTLRERLTICVADVAGKSTPAAILVSALHAALQVLVGSGRSTSDIMTELNHHFCQWSASNKFVTCVIATFDPRAGTLSYVNAGHNAPIMIRDGKLEMVSANGLPLGILPDEKYLEQTVPFPTGSLLCLYSDGITEAEDVDEEEFGTTRLMELVQAQSAEEAEHVSRAIMRVVDAFSAGTVQGDDQTVVVLRNVT